MTTTSYCGECEVAFVSGHISAHPFVTVNGPWSPGLLFVQVHELGPILSDESVELRICVSIDEHDSLGGVGDHFLVKWD